VTREEFLQGMADADSLSEMSQLGQEMNELADLLEEHDAALAGKLRGIFTAMEATVQYIKAQYPTALAR
jgi:hypothetical protein